MASGIERNWGAELGKGGKSKEGTCIYCGIVGALTNDHVPPRNLFSKPRLGLITVPSCGRCNGSFKLDDEYFRLAITTGVDPKDFPVAVEAIRKLGTPQKVRFAKSMLSNIQNSDLHLDRPRLHRVIERIVRGLFWHQRRQVLPPQVEMRIWFTCFDEAPIDDMEFNSLLDALKQQHLHDVGKGVFSYRHVFDSDQPVFSAWHFRFYEKNEVLGMIVPGAARSPGPH